MENFVLKTDKLTKSIYQKENAQVILKNITFKMNKGEFLSIMGPSGCGKSTLLYCISSLDDFDDGTVTILDKNISNLNDKEKSNLRRKNMGFVFQQATFLKKMSVLENIVLPALNDTTDKTKLKAKAVDLMAKLEISELDKRNVYQASGGELQRASICRALINDPELIFADEPTGALNSKNADEVINIFKKINDAGTSIIMVTHDPKIAMHTKRVLFMHDGQIIDDLNLEDISENQRLDNIHKKMSTIGI